MRRNTPEAIDAAIDAFVCRINTHPRPRKLEDEVARSVAVQCDDDPDLWDWSIRAFNATWIDSLEQKLSMRLPKAYRSFVSRYIFPEFGQDSVAFFANTPDVIGHAAHELRLAIFLDEHMFRVLRENGFLQFGQPAMGSYDPLCFDTRGVIVHGGDAVVRLDHEEILLRERIRCVEVVAGSFLSLVARPES